MKFRVLIIVFFELAVLSLQAQWSWRNPLPQGNDLYSACFPDPSTGYVVGQTGTIMKTSDFGQSWSIQTKNELSRFVLFQSVCFPIADTGYAMDHYGFIYKTTDAGINWDTVYYENDEYLNSMSFTSTRNGTIVGSGGKILRTDNGGDTWEYQIYPSSNYFTSIFFTEPDIGYITGSDGVILKSINSGNSWLTLNADSGLTFNDCFFTSSTRGCLVSADGKIRNTYDGGQTWTETNLGDSIYFFKVSMFNSDTMLVTGRVMGSFSYYPILMRSINGGNSWDVIPFTYEYYSPFGLNCSPSGTAYCIGDFGFMAKSDDYGATWTVLSNVLCELNHFGACINDIDFPSGEIGYAVAGGYEMPVGTIIKTTDGGDSWFELDSSFYLSTFNDVKFLSDNLGFIAGNNLFSTADGGESWTLRYSVTASSNQIYSMDFPTTSLGFAVGTGGIFLKTSDNGNTWEQQGNVPMINYYSIYFPDQNTGYAAGKLKILKTTDSGNNWTEIPMSVTFREINFVTADIGYGVGPNGLILKTTDGGNSWTNLSISTTEPLYAVDFYDQDTGFVSGGTYIISGIIYKTTNGGISWVKQLVPTNSPIIGLCVNSVYDAFACSATGGLFAEPTTGSHTNILEPKASGRLKQTLIYPNPVTKSSTIQYTIEEISDVDLRIYSLKGEELQKLVCGQQIPGTYYTNPDLNSFPAGTYIFRLKIGSSLETGKIIKR